MLFTSTSRGGFRGADLAATAPRDDKNWGFLGFRGLGVKGFRGLGFRGLGFRDKDWGFWFKACPPFN